jgi:hypothetical protein
MLQLVFGVVSFFAISYTITCIQKGGPQRAIFMDSILILIMLPLLPFILLHRYLFEAKPTNQQYVQNNSLIKADISDTGSNL